MARTLKHLALCAGVTSIAIAGSSASRAETALEGQEHVSAVCHRDSWCKPNDCVSPDLPEGKGIRRIATDLGIGVGTVQRIVNAM